MNKNSTVLYPSPPPLDTALPGRPSRLFNSYTCVVLENAHIRVEILPGLGGKVQSMVEKRTGREALFAEPVVRPVSVLGIVFAWVCVLRVGG